MKTKILFILLIVGCGIQAQVITPKLMSFHATNEPIILVISNKGDSCVHAPVYIQKGATCTSNFASFDGMKYAITQD